MTVSEPKPMSRTKVVAYAIGLPLALLALVFLPVGRLDWTPGWIFIAFIIIVYGASALVLARVNPASIGRAAASSPARNDGTSSCSG
jgi:hypothetical protein